MSLLFVMWIVSPRISETTNEAPCSQVVSQAMVQLRQGIYKRVLLKQILSLLSLRNRNGRTNSILILERVDLRLDRLIVAIDIVSNHLPFLFIQPLPKSILAPKIELRLFPSTYPSLPSLRLPKIVYRTLSRWVRWIAPIFLHRSLRSFGKPTGVKGIGLDITCLRVIKIENGRRIEARWRTASSPWSPSAPTNTAEEMPRTWSGWFYFDINRQGLIVRHVVENVNNQRSVEGDNILKDILAKTVSNGKRFADGLGAVQVDKRVLQRDGSGLRRLNVARRIFPEPSPSNIFVSARTYC